MLDEIMGKSGLSRREFLKGTLIGGASIYSGIIEDVVRHANLVGKGLEWFSRFYANAPLFPPDKIRFLKDAAVYSGLLALGQLSMSCSIVQEPVVFQGKTYSNWEAYLLTQDLIRGPDLLVHPQYGPNNFSAHENNPVNQGWGAVDYDVPVGTPLVPTADAFRARILHGRIGGNALHLLHRYGLEGYVSGYGHLNEIAEIISKGTRYIGPVSGIEYMDQPLDKLKIVAYSGNTGTGPGGGAEPPHLHFEIVKTVNKAAPKPGVDPFEAGIDAKKSFGGVDKFGLPYGGRPVYGDGKTEIVTTIFENRRLENIRKLKLQESLDTLDKRVRESDLNNVTKGEILKRRTNPEDLRDYLGMGVLAKKSSPDGKPRYEFLPGSLPYALMLEFYARTPQTGQEFIAMLPFIFPEERVKSIYQKANPGVKL